MISKRLKNYWIYSVLHTILVIVISLLWAYFTFPSDLDNDTLKTSFAINRIILALFGIGSIWVTYAIIYNQESNKLNLRIDNICNSQLLDEEYRHKINSLKKLKTSKKIEDERYYSRLYSILHQAEKALNKVTTEQRLQAIYKNKEEEYKNMHQAGVISKTELDRQLNNLNYRKK